MRPAAVVVLLVLTGCASTAAPAGSPSSAPAPARAAPTSSVPTSAAPTSAAPIPPTAAATAQSWPTPGPSADPSPVVGTVGPVAWLPLPYQAPVDQDDPTEPAGKPRWCTADDLVMAPTTFDAGGGFFDFGYSLTARAGRRCSLQGYPTMRVSDPKNTWSVTSRAPDLFPVQPGGAVDDQHQGSADLRWAGGGMCITVDTSHLVVSLDLPHQGGRLTLEQSPRAWGCSTQMKAKEPANTGWTLVEPLGAFAPTIYDSPPVWVSLLSQPTSVRAGGVLSYQVQLDGHNTLGPSVGYRERLVEFDTGRVVASKAYRLDTSGLPALTRLGTLFDMELTVPADVPPGTQLYIDWESDIAGAGLDGSGPGPFTVTAADS
jgi:hypothetical protein